MEVITFDEEGNCLNGSFMDYLIPTAIECPDFELGETVTPCPHHPLGAKGVGESPNVGSPPAIVNAVIDALHETPRRRPHRHAVHAGAGVGGDAGPARASAMISAALTRTAHELSRAGLAVRDGDRRARAAPDERHAGRRRARPRRRDDRGVRRRRVRAAQRAALLAAGDRERRAAAAADPAGCRPPGRGRRGSVGDRGGSVTDRGGRREDGTVTVQNPCLSGGAIEVFLEPVLPAPRVVLAGDSPIVSALGRLGARARPRDRRRDGEPSAR